jgi:uncharacterized protein
MKPHFGNKVRKLGSAFSYTCLKCNKCCHGKGIQVNPYEIIRLSVFLETGTTNFRENYLEGHFLKHKDPSGSCIFLEESGCSVHKDRPLVCRLYPLGKLRFDDGEEIFPEVVAHSACMGIQGEAATVEKYLESQETEPYFHAEKLYRGIIGKMAEAVIRAQQVSDNIDIYLNNSSGNDSGWILDPDPVIKKYCEQKDVGFPYTVNEKVDVHLAALNAWVDGTWEPFG